jgi:hypothetical protein
VGGEGGERGAAHGADEVQVEVRLGEGGEVVEMGEGLATSQGKGGEPWIDVLCRGGHGRRLGGGSRVRSGFARPRPGHEAVGLRPRPRSAPPEAPVSGRPSPQRAPGLGSSRPRTPLPSGAILAPSGQPHPPRVPLRGSGALTAPRLGSFPFWVLPLASFLWFSDLLSSSIPQRLRRLGAPRLWSPSPF